MAGYRDLDMQPKVIPVDFAKQTLPSTFEHTLHVLIHDELDLSRFLKDDTTGAPGTRTRCAPEAGPLRTCFR